MRFRDLANKNVRVFFDLGSDYTGTTGGGVWVDDVVFRGVNYEAPASFCSDLIARPSAVDLGSVQNGQTYCDSFFLVNLNPFTPVSFDSIRADCEFPLINVDTTRAGGPVAPGDSVVVVVCITPAQVGAGGACDITIWNNSTNAFITVPVTWEAIVTVVGIPDGVPAPFRIRSVAPNPFNPVTTVSFTLPEALPITAEVWSVNGARVRTLARNRLFGPGANTIQWDGLNDAGASVASGVYFIRIHNLFKRVAA